MPGASQNVARTLVGGRPNRIGDAIRQVSQQGAAPNYFRAVVLDVFYDPGLLSDSDKLALKSYVSNPNFVENMPPNSIIGRLVSGGQDTVPLPSLIYPFFQSHFALPVQAGEHVQVIFEDFQQFGTALGHWVTRIPENHAVEDINFTHADRRFNPLNNQSAERTSTTADRSNNTSQPEPPAFPNGGGTVDSFTLTTSGSANPYEQIYRTAAASKLHEYEAVPRFTKRPQEFALQGMHNSLIVLGQDRVGPALRVSGSAQTDKQTYAGSIDMVVGRGRYPLAPGETPASNKLTSAVVVQNSRQKLEVDKTPKLRNKQDNRREGDPSFSMDASRLFMCMNTKGDTNFGILQGTNSTTTDYQDNTLRKKEQGNGSEPTPASERIGNAYFIGKADHVRLIARKASVPNGGNIKGSVLLLKEGTKGTDQAYFYINQDGLMQLEAKRIFLGKAVTESSPDSDGHTEPYIKWTVYKQHIDELKAQIKELSDHVQSLVTQYNGAFQTSISLIGVPVASLVAIGNTTNPQTISKITAIKSKIDTIHPEDAKSKVIFGS